LELKISKWLKVVEKMRICHLSDIWLRRGGMLLILVNAGGRKAEDVLRRHGGCELKIMFFSDAAFFVV
jgi:hypothetical protein